MGATYYARNPAAWLQIDDRVQTIQPGTDVVVDNIVTAYKIVVNDIETAYDSFYQTRRGPQWLVFSKDKPLTAESRAQLHREIAMGTLAGVTGTPASLNDQQENSDGR